MSVVKADAYGIGLANTLPTLLASHIKEFAVASAEEALSFLHTFNNLKKKTTSTLFKNSLGLPKVILLGDFLSEELPLLIQAEGMATDLTIPITSIEQAQHAHKLAKEYGKVQNITLVLDTGMGRIGTPHRSAIKLAEEVAKLPNLKVTDCYSHFPSADDSDPIEIAFTQSQIKLFLRYKKKLNEIFSHTIHFHIANSFGFGFQKESHQHFERIRLGIGHYGVYQRLNKKCDLQPCLRLKSQLISKRKLPKGHSIGYNRTYTLKRPTWVGTIPVGYADGIPYALGLNTAINTAKKPKSWVIIHGEKAPLIGKVSMDYITIDLTDTKHKAIHLGDEVTLLGEDLSSTNASSDPPMTFEDWAKIKKTHPYDILTSFSPRVKRMVMS